MILKTTFLKIYKKLLLKKKVKKSTVLKHYLKKTKFKKTKSVKTKLVLTRKLRKLLRRFKRNDAFDKRGNKIRKKLSRLNRSVISRRLRRNLNPRSYFFKIIRKTFKKRFRVKNKRSMRLFVSKNNKPALSRRLKKDTYFLLRSRDKLLKVKRYLYRKQFPKIKGKKNKNFSFAYYNNIENLPLSFKLGRVVITYLFNNTFINIHNTKKMLKVISAGKIGFKGPKRSTPYSRQIVMRQAVNFICKSDLNVLDIFLNSNYNRWYYFLFKELNKPRVRSYVIRYLVISNPRAHGFIRFKKPRRK